MPRNAREFVRSYVASLEEALGCITHQRLHLSLNSTSRITAGHEYSALLGNADGVALRGAHPIRFTAIQTFRLVLTGTNGAQAAPAIQLVSYAYVFVDGDGRELLAFHWTPEARGSGEVLTPHLHVGARLLNGQQVVRPRDMHKAHIPTGRVEPAAIVRFAITEFGVSPLLPNWRDVLDRLERPVDRFV